MQVGVEFLLVYVILPTRFCFLIFIGPICSTVYLEGHIVLKKICRSSLIFFDLPGAFLRITIKTSSQYNSTSSRTVRCFSFHSRKMPTSSHAPSESHVPTATSFYLKPKVAIMKQDRSLCLFNYTDLLVTKTPILFVRSVAPINTFSDAEGKNSLIWNTIKLHWFWIFKPINVFFCPASLMTPTALLVYKHVLSNIFLLIFSQVIFCGLV